MLKDDYDKIINHFREKFVGKTIKIPYYFQTDKNGYLDCRCHNCGYDYKIHAEDWDNLNKNLFCPLCKSIRDKEKWTTPEQEIKKKEQFEQSIHEILGTDVHNEIEQLYSKDEIKSPYQIEGFPFQNDYTPEKVRDASQIEIVCDNCNIKYAIFGSAYFCPNCGHCSYQKIHQDSDRKIRAKLSLAIQLIESNSKPDENIIVSRSLIETALNDCVITFQFSNDNLFKNRFPGIVIRFNLFQNIDEGNAFWKQHQPKGYSDILTSGELDRIKIYFQRRHLLSHTDGMVDQKYITKTNDLTYQIGQRIVIKKEDVEDCITLITKILDQL